jgi:hypothetical protein
MNSLHEERQLSARQRRALELLAAAGEQGCTGARLFNHGFTVGVLADLVWSGARCRAPRDRESGSPEH